MFKVSPASLQTFIDTPNCVLEDRIEYSTVHIPNAFYDGHIQVSDFKCSKHFYVFLYCKHQVYRDFLIILYHTSGHTLYQNVYIVITNFLVMGLHGSKRIKDTL
jgi:hypothetical protein